MEISLCTKLVIVGFLLIAYALFFGWGILCLVRYRKRKKSLESQPGVGMSIIEGQQKAAYSKLIEDNLLGWSVQTYLSVLTNAFLALSAIIGFILAK
jgi:hypothetical protein